MKCPSLGTSRICIILQQTSLLSSCLLVPMLHSLQCPTIWCFEKVFLVLCNLFAYSTSVDTLKAWCLTADLVGSSFSLISCRTGRTALMEAGGAALPGLPGGREVWEAAVAKGYSCFFCAGKGRC